MSSRRLPSWGAAWLLLLMLPVSWQQEQFTLDPLRDVVITLGQVGYFFTSATPPMSGSGTWYHNGNELTVVPGKHVVVTSGPTMRLIIYGVTEGDLGTYTFRFLGQSTSATLSLEGVGQILSPLSDTSVQIGGSVSLEMQISVPNIQNASWTRNSVPISSDGRITISSSGRTQRLSIIGAQASDQGTYVISVLGLTSSCFLTVQQDQLEIMQPLQSSYSISPGGTLILQVTLNQASAGSYWLKDSQVVTSGGRISVTVIQLQYRLTISNVQPSDAGTYQFVAYDAVVQRTSMTTVIVPTATVSIAEEMNSISVLEGTSLSLIVQLNGGDGQPGVWTGPNGVIQASDPEYNLRTSGARRILDLANAQLRHGGSYTFSIGGATTTGVVTVVERLENQAVTSGQAATFASRVVPTETLPGTWTRNGVPLSNSAKYQMLKNGNSHQLVIQGAQQTDIGPYTYSVNGVSTTASLSVTEPGNLQIVQGFPSSHTVNQGGTLMLEVTLNQDNIQGYWIKDRQLAPDARTTIDASGRVHRLTISNMAPSDAGVYQFVAYGTPPATLQTTVTVQTDSVTPWGDWFDPGCPVTCGSGVSRNATRTRSCRLGPGSCTADLVDVEVKICTLSQCPIHGGYSQWTEWLFTPPDPCPPECDTTATRTEYRSRACTNPPPQFAGNPCSGDSTGARQFQCSQRAQCAACAADVVFVLDNSQWKVDLAKTGIKSVITSSLAINSDLRFGIVLYDNAVTVTVPLSSDNTYLQAQIDAFPAGTSGTFTSAGIDQARLLLTGSLRTRIMVVITDSPSSNQFATRASAAAAKNEGIIIVAVSLTESSRSFQTLYNITVQEMQDISSGGMYTFDYLHGAEFQTQFSLNAFTCMTGNDGWTSWTDWTRAVPDVCTATCGDATRRETRTRTCTRGSSCQGSDTMTRDVACTTLPRCPVHGGWSQFGDWNIPTPDPCAVGCDTSASRTETRFRSCTNPVPQFNGNFCSGSTTDTRVVQCSQLPQCSACQIIYLLDHSESLPSGEVTQVRNAVKQQISSTLTSQPSVQIGIVVYTEVLVRIIDLSSDISYLLGQIDALGNGPQGGGSATHLALDRARGMLGGSGNSNRKFIVSINDGLSNFPSLTSSSAATARTQGIIMISVVITSAVRNFPLVYSNVRSEMSSLSSGTAYQFDFLTASQFQSGFNLLSLSCNSQGGGWLPWGVWVPGTCSASCGFSTNVETRRRTCSHGGGLNCAGPDEETRSGTCSRPACDDIAIVSGLQDRTVLAGRDATFQAFLSAEDSRPGRWYKDEMPLTNTAKTVIGGQGRTRTLTIRNSVPDDEATYIYVIGSATTSARLKVDETGVLETNLQDSTSFRGDNTTLQVIVADSSIGPGAWYKDGVLLDPSTGRYQASTNGRVRTLTINNVLDSDATVFTYRVNSVSTSGNLIVNIPIAGFGPWSGWTDAACPVNCGDYIVGRFRSRECVNPVAQCFGELYETIQENCAPGPCDVNGAWTSWTNWPDPVCSNICGTDPLTIVRARTCTNPEPLGTGLDCQGPRTETSVKPCDLGPCSVDGVWTAWTPYTDPPCDNTCGSSPKTIRRTRSCTNPAPSGGGRDCVGIAEETSVKQCTFAPCFDPDLGLCDRSLVTMRDELGYRYHPVDCDKYIQCYYNPTGNVVGVYRQCPFGHYWDQRTFRCDYSWRVQCPLEKCNESCSANYNMEGSCRAHWTCYKGMSRAECCPMGFSYVMDQGCRPNFFCRDVCPTPCASRDVCDKRPRWISTTDSYEILKGVSGWSEARCPTQTSFNLLECGCAALNSTCSPDYSVAFNDGTFQNMPWLSLTGIPVTGGRAQLGRAGTFKANINMKTPTGKCPLIIHFRFRETGATSERRVLLSTSDCRNGNTLVISMDDDHVIFELTSWYETTVRMYISTNDFSPSAFKAVTVAYTGYMLTGMVESGNIKYINQVFASQSSIMECGLQLGSDGDSNTDNNFVGDIERLTIYRCDPGNMF